jgi:secondary thiamine-phosphate synthase enzyme
MTTQSLNIELSTRGYCDIHNITEQVQQLISSSQINDGIVCVSLIGSTGAITTVEYESGLVKDIQEFLEDLLPQNKGYHHDATWGDANGFSHLRSTLLGTSASFPFNNKRLLLGTWQQIIFIDFDNQARQRNLIVQIVGD